LSSWLEDVAKGQERAALGGARALAGKFENVLVHGLHEGFGQVVLFDAARDVLHWNTFERILSFCLFVVIRFVTLNKPAVHITSADVVLTLVLSGRQPAGLHGATTVGRVTAEAALIIQGVVDISLALNDVLNARLVNFAVADGVITTI